MPFLGFSIKTNILVNNITKDIRDALMILCVTKIVIARPKAVSLKQQLLLSVAIIVPIVLFGNPLLRYDFRSLLKKHRGAYRTVFVATNAKDDLHEAKSSVTLKNKRIDVYMNDECVFRCDSCGTYHVDQTSKWTLVIEDSRDFPFGNPIVDTPNWSRVVFDKYPSPTTTDDFTLFPMKNASPDLIVMFNQFNKSYEHHQDIQAAVREGLNNYMQQNRIPSINDKNLFSTLVFRAEQMNPDATN